MSCLSIPPFFRYLTEEESSTLRQTEWICPNCQEGQEGEEASPLVTHCDNPKQHAFHKNCVIDWLREHNECMVCRQFVVWYRIASVGEWLRCSPPWKWTATTLGEGRELVKSTPGLPALLVSTGVTFAGRQIQSNLISALGFAILTRAIHQLKREQLEDQLFYTGYALLEAAALISALFFFTITLQELQQEAPRS